MNLPGTLFHDQLREGCDRDLVHVTNGMQQSMEICCGKRELLLLCFHLGRRAQPFVKHSRRVVYFETPSSFVFMVGGILRQSFLWEDCKMFR